MRHNTLKETYWKYRYDRKADESLKRMVRLNSGIYRIFNLRVWNLDLTSSDCRASEIIWNDTEPDAVSWESRRENSIFNFRVGKTVCGHRPASLNLFYDGVFLNLQHFDTKLMGAAQRGKKLWPKNRPKNGFYGGWNCVGWHEIQWIPLFYI